MNLVHLTTLSPRYLADFERRHPGTAARSFAEHRAALYRDHYAWGDHYVRHLEARGHRGQHIIANYTALQEKWARENSFVPDPGAAVFSIAQAQVQAARPDLLFVEDCHAFPKPKIRVLVASAPSIRAVACYHGIDSDIVPLVPEEALVLTCGGFLVEDWRRIGYNATLLHHAFEPAVLQALPSARAKSSLTFIGSASPLEHPERHAWLKTLAHEIPALDLWTDSFEAPANAMVRSMLFTLSRGRFRDVATHLTSPLRRRALGAVYGLPMYEKLRNSLVTLNRHISQSRPAAGNMRLFEATGTGACLVTDARSDLVDLFAPDAEVVTYASTSECIEKVRWLLDHPAGAREIAERGQRRTLRDHTFAVRAARLEALFLEHLRAHGRSRA